MPEDPDRRHLLDPRYVTWEAFDRRAREVDGRIDRMQDDAELFRTRVASELSELREEVAGVRVGLARLAAYAAVIALVVGGGLGPFVTWLLLHH